MIGLRIAALRKAAGWSQAELAQRLKISPSAVGMYEQGRREPALQMLIQLSELFGVTIDYLVTGREWPAGNRREEFIVLTDCPSRFRADGAFRPVSDRELRSILRELLWDD